MEGIVLHVNRELIHHGAEISLLRDLYRWQDSAARARFHSVAAPPSPSGVRRWPFDLARP